MIFRNYEKNRWDVYCDKCGDYFDNYDSHSRGTCESFYTQYQNFKCPKCQTENNIKCSLKELLEFLLNEFEFCDDCNLIIESLLTLFNQGENHD